MKQSAFEHFQNTYFCVIYEHFHHGDQKKKKLNLLLLLYFLVFWKFGPHIVRNVRYTHTRTM